MTLWDVGGQDKIRALWRHYYENTDALIWIIDSADESRLSESRDELHRVLSEDLLRNASILVMANKQDMPHALRPERLSEALGLRSLRTQPWYIQGCSALTGEGLFEGLEWLHGSLRQKRRVASAA